jgi:transcriptional regulator GlxA family with amidase domain
LRRLGRTYPIAISMSLTEGASLQRGSRQSRHDGGTDHERLRNGTRDKRRRVVHAQFYPVERRPENDAMVPSAIAMMEDAVEDRLSMSDLGRKLGVSSDKLERAFQPELDTCSEYLLPKL